MADDPVACACKGIRSCLICEKQGKFSNQQQLTIAGTIQAYVFCNRCNLCYRCTDGSKTETQEMANCQDHVLNASLQVKGIKVVDNFLSLQEESEMIDHIDLSSWAISQSGRKKQVNHETK